MIMNYEKFQLLLQNLRVCDELFNTDAYELAELSEDEFIAYKAVVSRLADVDFGELQDKIEEAQAIIDEQ